MKRIARRLRDFCWLLMWVLFSAAMLKMAALMGDLLLAGSELPKL